ncbi:MAG: hypothetical protein Kow00124_03890 [Anaerolineae bacterium]
MRPTATMLIGVGLWLAVGLFTLYEPVVMLAGRPAAWAYLASGLALVPTLLNYFEVRSWVGYAGGSYRLIRVTERPHLAFLAGWSYLLGWAAISALLALSAADSLTKLLAAYLPPGASTPVLAAGLLVIFMLVGMIGVRPQWRLAIWAMAAAILAILVLIVLVMMRLPPGEPAAGAQAARSGGYFISAVALLTAPMWAAELEAEMGARRDRGMRSTLALWFGGILLAAPLGLVIARWLPGAASLDDIAAALHPDYGRLAAPIVTLLVSGLAWQIITLLMARRVQIIGRDGWLPDLFLNTYTRFKTPVFLLLAQGGLALLLLILSTLITTFLTPLRGPVVHLAALAAFAYLSLLILLNMAAALLARHPRAEKRPIRLPLYPVIPAVGGGVGFLLILALPLPAIGLGLIWVLVGVLVYVQFAREGIRSSQVGLTVFQDTGRQPDLTSTYPVVVAVANPDTAHALAAFGASIARHHNGHLTLLQIIEVPNHLPLDSERSLAQRKHDLLEQIIQGIEEQYGVPVDGVTRLSRSVSQGIIDTLAEEQARLVVLGWQGRGGDSPTRRLGHILDEVVENAPCDVAIVRGAWDQAIRRILVPVGGGPNAPRAAELALWLTPDDGHVTLLHVSRPDEGDEAAQKGRALLDDVRISLGTPERVQTRALTAASIQSGITDALADHDAILMGASEQGFMAQQWFGALPLQLARSSDKPIVLVRNYTSFGQFIARKAWHSLSDVLPTLTAQEQMDVYQRMRRAARPSINYFVLIALSAVIATLGLLLNSPAVIIGAMLVAPLMSPIVAAAVGIVFGDGRTLRTALTATIQGVLLAIFIAILITLISPLATATPEVLARTRPNLLDLMVALASGMAGAYAIARKEVGEALPGVAIAAALMPPVCAVGIGFALSAIGQVSITLGLGALLLFLANLAGIIVASTFVFLLLGLSPPQSPERQRSLRQGLIVSLASLAVISIPLGLILFQSVQSSQMESQTRLALDEMVSEWGDVQVVDLDIDYNRREIAITGTLYTGEAITSQQLTDLSEQLSERLKREVTLNLFVVRGERLSLPADGSSR